jgi:hypothetical protein
VFCGTLTQDLKRLTDMVNCGLKLGCAEPHGNRAQFCSRRVKTWAKRRIPLRILGRSIRALLPDDVGFLSVGKTPFSLLDTILGARPCRHALALECLQGRDFGGALRLCGGPGIEIQPSAWSGPCQSCQRVYHLAFGGGCAEQIGTCGV